MRLSFRCCCCCHWLLACLLFDLVGAVLNLNLKSSHLTDLLRKNDARIASQDGAQTSKMQQKTDILQLDLSGRMHTHVVGAPQYRLDTDDEIIRPLIRVGGPFSLIFSTDYDFSRRWYGAQRFFATLRWKRPFLRTSSLMPMQVDVVGEQGIDVGARDASAGQLVFGWGGGDDAHGILSTVRVRTTRSGDASLKVALPVHKRVDLEMNFVNGKQLPHQERIRKKLEDWWIPDVALNALGHLKSQNEGWFRSPLKQFDGSFGVRLTVRRRLGWSVLGLATDQEPETWVGVDLQSIDGQNRYSTTARVEAQLQRLRRSAHLSLRQDVAVGTIHR